MILISGLAVSVHFFFNLSYAPRFAFENQPRKVEIQKMESMCLHFDKKDLLVGNH